MSACPLCGDLSTFDGSADPETAQVAHLRREQRVAAERARVRGELLAASAEIMYGPSDSALRDALDRICPEES